MKKILGALLAVTALAGSEAFALPFVTFSDGPGNTGGGEFNASTSANGNFITFCLEYQEHISFGNTFYYEVSQAARWNGNGTVDPISRATAWLYLQFLDGTLGTFGAAYAYTSTNNDADDLQKAFWFLEGEDNGVNNYYAQLAVANADGGMANNDGYYGVGVMNLWTNSNGTGAAQDQLIRVPPTPNTNSQPVPDGGSTIVLLGLSLMATACFARRGGMVPALAKSTQVR